MKWIASALAPASDPANKKFFLDKTNCFIFTGTHTIATQSDYFTPCRRVCRCRKLLGRSVNLKRREVNREEHFCNRECRNSVG